MTPRIKKPVGWLLTAAFCTLCFAGSASAELVYLWKTSECPVLPDKGAAKSFIVGVMQAPVVTNSFDEPISVGGPYCDLVEATKSSTFGFVKVHKVLNADIVASPGDPGSAQPGEVWDCVLCNYTEQITPQFPTLSLIGTALLFGGLLTAAFYELRRRRARIPTA